MTQPKQLSLSQKNGIPLTAMREIQSSLAICFEQLVCRNHTPDRTDRQRLKRYGYGLEQP
jgi:hypothetical protein